MKTKEIIKELENYFIILTRKQKQTIIDYWGEELPNSLIENISKKELYERIIKTMPNYEKSIF